MAEIGPVVAVAALALAQETAAHANLGRAGSSPRSQWLSSGRGKNATGATLRELAMNHWELSP